MIYLKESDGEFRVIFWLQVTENQLELTLGGKEDCCSIGLHAIGTIIIQFVIHLEHL